MFLGMSIGKLAKATGTAVETVRYYEKIGLLPDPPRTSGNYRSYGPEEVARLSFVRRARNLGFGIAEVRSLLDLADDRRRPCGDVDKIARNQLDQVERKITDLEALRHELSSLIKQCRQGTIADCRIIEALGPQDRLDQ